MCRFTYEHHKGRIEYVAAEKWSKNLSDNDVIAVYDLISTNKECEPVDGKREYLKLVRYNKRMLTPNNSITPEKDPEFEALQAKYRK